MIDIPWVILPRLAAGVIDLALAVLLLHLGFSLTTHRALAFSLAVLGVIRVLESVASVLDEPPEGYWRRVTVYYSLAAPVTLVAFAAVYPARARWLPRDPWTLSPFLVVIGATSLAYALDASLWFGSQSALQWYGAVANNAAAAVAVFFVYAYATGRVRSEATSVLLVSVAVALLTGADDVVRFMRMLGGTRPLNAETPLDLFGDIAFLARITTYFGLIATLLILASRASAGPNRSSIRRSAALLALPFVVGISASQFFAPGAVLAALRGVWASLSALLLTYALVRGNFLDIDVKIRFAISKSTIAAIFIAVFFIASEAAQQFFGETLGSTYVGIAAAGLLVFALAPLQRAAERLAEKAVPVTTPDVQSVAPDAHERYRILLRRFLREGNITRDEEMALAHAASGMGLPAHEALRLRHEAEDERAARTD